MLPTRTNLPRSRTAADLGGLSGTKMIIKRTTRPTAQAKPQPVIQPQFELRGTQSKLLFHTPVRLISPVLNKPRHPCGFLEDSGSTRTSIHPRVEVSLTQGCYPTDTQTDSVLTSSRPHSAEHVTSEVCPSFRPNSFTEDHAPIRQSQAESPRSVGLPEPAQSTGNVGSSVSQYEPEKARRVPKTRSGDSYNRNGILPGFDSAESSAFIPLTSPSGDSGVSYNSELDYLIGRLSELPQTLMITSSGGSNEELEVGKEDRYTRKVVPLSPETKNVGLMVETTEDEAVCLVDRLYTVLRQSNIASKRQWPNRATILQAVFALLDKASPRLHLALIRIVLTVITSCEEMLPTRTNLPRSRTAADLGGLSGTKMIIKRTTRPTAQAKPQPVIQPQFELRGTQSKLLFHTPVRLISPVLNKPRHPCGFLEDSGSTRTSIHPSGRENSIRRNPTPIWNASNRSSSSGKSRLFLDRVEVSLTQGCYPTDT
ncbi:hypothetical protein AHF37_12351, partial [Paragonimus kellicotti]